MGLLDGLVGQVLGGQGLGAALGGEAGAQGGNVLQTVLAVINSPAVGGLQGLLAHLQQGGLGHAVSSWISTGPNVAVTGQQLQGALPADLLSGLASQLGLAPGDLSQHLAQALPTLVDKVTPDGQMPHESSLGALLGGLLK